MKAYTTKHILSIIGLTLLIGIPFGFLYGWQFCLLIACAVLCYSLAVFFKNPTHPVLWFGYPDWMDTKTVWKNIGCNLLLAIGVAAGCTALSDVCDPSIKVIIITAACLLCFVSGYLTRKVIIMTFVDGSHTSDRAVHPAATPIAKSRLQPMFFHTVFVSIQSG